MLAEMIDNLLWELVYYYEKSQICLYAYSLVTYYYLITFEKIYLQYYEKLFHVSVEIRKNFYFRFVLKYHVIYVIYPTLHFFAPFLTYRRRKKVQILGNFLNFKNT